MIRPLLSAIALNLIAAQTSQAAAIQWSSAVGGNDHFYELTAVRMNWDVAESFAQSVGGHLVSITSAAEQAFIVANFLVGANDRLPVWLGINDVATEGTFVWTTGEPVTYTNWDNNEPNNLGDEDYGVINWNHAAGAGETKGSWNDNHVNGTVSPGGQFDPITLPYFAIVETVPEPGTMGLIMLSTACSFRRRR